MLVAFFTLLAFTIILSGICSTACLGVLLGLWIAYIVVGCWTLWRK